MELVLKNINKSFKDKIAVNNFNVTLNNGIYGLLGPNGAGKTSLMRIIADVSNATSGEVYLNGKSKSELGADYRSLLGYLPQDVGFYKTFTAQNFLEYVSTLKGLEKEYSKVKIDELLKFVNLEKDRNRK
ncbi:ATP-binding cassette domain-containing protein, partial [Acinetobacter sp. RIT592]